MSGEEDPRWFERDPHSPRRVNARICVEPLQPPSLEVFASIDVGDDLDDSYPERKAQTMPEIK